MNINVLKVGLLEENCYIIEKNNEVLIIDPGDEFLKIKEKIGNRKVLGVLLTHAHFDHVGALNEILKFYNATLYYNNINNEIKYNNLINLKEKNYNVKEFSFEVIFTPGHRNDSVTFYFKKEKIMFTGDFLFRLSIGRTDLKYANGNDMQKSINKIKEYNNDIKVYPGHGESTILGFEKENNPFFR